MQPFPKSLSIACPKCRSLRVTVPWDLIQSERRKQLKRSALVLWASYLAWLAGGLVAGFALLWVLPLLVYLAASTLLFFNWHRSAQTNRCLSCDHRWAVTRNLEE